MGKVCKNCGYERKLEDIAPYFECPKCGMIYAKSEKILEDKKKQQYSVLSERTIASTPTTQQYLSSKLIKFFILIVIICTCSGLYHFFQILSHKNSINTMEELRRSLAEDTSENPFKNIPADYEMTMSEIEMRFKYADAQDNRFYTLCDKLIRITGIVKKIFIDNNNNYILIDDSSFKLNLHPCHKKYMEQMSKVKGMKVSVKCRLECGQPLPVNWNCVLDLP